MEIEINSNEDEREIEAISNEVYKTIKAGGLALLPDGIGYGLVGNSESSIRRIYQLKQRPLTKPLTHYMNFQHSQNVANISLNDQELIQRITEITPCCFVVPYKESKYFKNLGAFPLSQSTKDKTVALFFERDDPLVKRLLEQSSREDFALIVSSANTSGEGNSYTIEDVPSSIRNGADLVVYSFSPCQYKPQESLTKKKLGSTLIRLPGRKLIRKGVMLDLISKLLEE